MALEKAYFRLYQSDGVSLIYTFPLVQEANYPQTPRKSVVVEGQRGKGAVVIDGGEASWEMTIRGLIMIDTADEGYEEIIVDIDALESAVAVNTPYILKISKTDSTNYEYRVKRIEAIEYPQSLRTDSQEYIVKLLVNSW